MSRHIYRQQPGNSLSQYDYSEPTFVVNIGHQVEASARPWISARDLNEVSMPDRRARVRFVAIALTALLPAAVIGAASGQASAAATPSIRLLAGTTQAEIHQYARGRYDIHFPVRIASVDGPFELWAQRDASYETRRRA